VLKLLLIMCVLRLLWSMVTMMPWMQSAEAGPGAVAEDVDDLVEPRRPAIVTMMPQM
jgi:hypothetical protein